MVQAVFRTQTVSSERGSGRRWEVENEAKGMPHRSARRGVAGDARETWVHFVAAHRTSITQYHSQFFCVHVVRSSSKTQLFSDSAVLNLSIQFLD